MQSKRLSRVFSNTTVQAHQILQCSALFILQLSHPYMTTEKTIVLTRRTFVGKVMSLLFNMLSSLATTFLSTSKHLLISWLQSPPAVIFRSVAQSCPTLFSLVDCKPARLLCPWNSSGKNVGVGCHSLFHRIFLNQDCTQVS